MKRLTGFYLAMFITSVLFTTDFVQKSQAADGEVNILSEAEKADGWTLLFDGRTLLGWNARGGPAQWSVEDGSITAVAGEGPSYIGSTGDYTNFHLKIDFWTEEGHNSGVFIRGHRMAPVNQNSFYEINIADTHWAGFTTGSIVEKKVYEPVPVTAGKWSTFDIVAKDSDLSVTLNGHKGLEIQDSIHYSGTIVLQAFGKGRVKFRNIKLLDLH